MSIVKFLVSKVFFKQLAIALVVVLVLSFIILQWLNKTTNHDEYIEVPSVLGKTLEVVDIELKDHKLRMVIQDSANYNPRYPKFSVIEQHPLAGSKVKENRKIYLILNRSEYRKVRVPDVIRVTIRQVRPTLEALGFKVGKIIYKDDIGKDEVLALQHKGEPIKAGKLLPRTSEIDLVLGNGKFPTSE